jgi:putative intracellular protease/amidase
MAKVLILASNMGLWAEELQGPWDVLTEAGHDLQLATFKGKTPLPLAFSMNPASIDRKLGTPIVPQHVYERSKALLESGAWDNPLLLGNIQSPAGPLTGIANMDPWDAIVIVGGQGASVDLSGNHKVHQLLVDAWQHNKTIGTLCYGVGALAWARQPDDYKKSIVYGKTIVAHPKEWDYDMNIFYKLYNETEDNPSPDFQTPGFMYPLRAIMEDAVGYGVGTVISPPETTRDHPCTHYDAPFVTGLSVESSQAFGQHVAQVLAGNTSPTLASPAATVA